LLGGLATTQQVARLDELLLCDVEARQHYVRFMHDSIALFQWGNDRGMAASADQEMEGGVGIPISEQFQFAAGVGVFGSASSETSAVANLHFPDRPPSFPRPVFPALSAAPAPPHSSPFRQLVNFHEIWLLSYTISALLTGMLLLALWGIKTSHYSPDEMDGSQVAAAGWAGGAGLASDDRREIECVARVTGMVDCKWSDPTYKPLTTRIARDMKLKLDSGLLEITYQTGPKVILQGPCSYQVNSPYGGYLELGKLTARVDTKEAGSSLRPKSARKSRISDPFFVRTPTALITDLGTEFGVEVKENAWTTSHVFRGRVLITVLGLEGEKKSIMLSEDESAVVNGGEVEVRRQNEAAASFYRELPPNPFPGLAYLHEGALVFSESFDRNSQTPAADYPELQFFSGEVSSGAGKTLASMHGGALHLSREGGDKGRSWDVVQTTRRFRGPVIATVDMGADSSWIGDASVGLRLNELLLVFHPGLTQWRGKEVRGLFRIEKRRPGDKKGIIILPNTELGFASHVDLLHHLFLYYDGQDTFHACLIDGLNPRKIFRTSFTDPCLRGRDFFVGIQRDGRPNRGMFDNLCVYQLPPRKSEAKSDGRPSINNPFVQEDSTMNGS
jgi:hypothetical protein